MANTPPDAQNAIPPPPPGFVPLSSLATQSASAPTDNAIPPPPPGFVPLSQLQTASTETPKTPAPESVWGQASDLANHVVDLMPGIGGSRQIAKAIEDWTAKKQQELAASGGFKSPALTGVTNYALGETHDLSNLYRTLTQPSSLAIAGAAHVPILGTAVAAGLTAQGAKGMAESWGDLVAPNQPGQDTPWYDRLNPDAAQKFLESASLAVGGVAATAETTPKAIEAGKSIHEAIRDKTADPLAQQAQKTFMKAIPPSRSAPYNEADFQAILPHLEEMHADEPLEATPKEIEQSMTKIVDKIEIDVREKIATAPDTPIGINPLDSVREALAKDPDKTFLDRGLRSLARFKWDNLTLEEADKLRWKLNQMKDADLQKNGYDYAKALASNPAFAAADAASEALRNGVYNTLDKLGFPDVDKMRLTEGSAIKIRKAAARQEFNNERTVKGSGAGGGVRKAAAGAVRGAGMIAGMKGGAAIAGNEGAIIGAGVGRAAAEPLARVVGGSDVTRGDLLQQTLDTLADRRAAREASANLPAAQKAVTEEAAPQDVVENAGGVYRGNKGGMVEITLPREMTDKLPIDDRMKDFVSITLPENKITPESVKEAMNRKVIEMGGPGFGETENPNEGAAKTPTAPTMEHVGDDKGGSVILRDTQGKEIGRVRYRMNPDNTASITASHIDPELDENGKFKYRGKGLGQEMYLQVADAARARGATALTSDLQGTTTMDAARAWDKLQEKGHPVEKVPSKVGSPGYRLDLVQKAVTAPEAAEAKATEANAAEAVKGGLQERLPKNAHYPGDVQSDIDHEVGHHVVAQANGIKTTGGVLSDRHPLTTGVAAIQFDFSPWADEDGNVTIDSIAPHVDEVVRAYLGGPAADEVLHGHSLEDNAGAAGDLDIVRGLLRDLGFSPEDAEAKIAKLYQEAKEPLTKPGVADKIRELTATREAGIPTTQHVSQDRLDQLSEDLGYGKKSGGNAGQSNAARGATANKGVRENVDTGTKGGGAKKSKVSNAATAAITAGAVVAGIKAAKALAESRKPEPPAPVSKPIEVAAKKPADIPALLDQAAEDYKVPPALLHAQAIQESKLDPNAVSPKGAQGVMQLEPKTAKSLGVDDAFDPTQNIPAGAAYMQTLHRRFGHWDRALAAYNAGPDRVQEAIDQYGDDWLDHTPQETQDYVHKILRKSIK